MTANLVTDPLTEGGIGIRDWRRKRLPMRIRRTLVRLKRTETQLYDVGLSSGTA